MNCVNDLKEKILNGYKINKQEALDLVKAPLDELSTAANEIRKHFAVMILIFALLLMENLVDVPRTVNIVHNQLIILQK